MTVTSRPPRSPRGASIIIPGLLPTILFIASVLSSCQAPGRSPALAFRDVRVFDGERTIPQATVIVKDGHIAAVGTDLAIPAGARVIEGEGRTLLPGLIDAHVHLEPNVLRRSLIFGVTTEISMGDDPKDVIGLQTAQLEHGAVDRADVFTSGWIVTPPGGMERSREALRSPAWRMPMRSSRHGWKTAPTISRSSIRSAARSNSSGSRA
jgi:hypothetical protein